MKALNVCLLLASILIASSAHGGSQIVEIFQPTSLLGTDTEDDPLGDGQDMAATIVSRPVVIGGAFPESPVHAMSLPHKIEGATDGFPTESNLIVLVGAEINAKWGENSHVVTADFSKAQASEDLDVTLLQVMQLTAECLRRNLQGEGTPITILWKAPKGQETLLDQLPKEIKEE